MKLHRISIMILFMSTFCASSFAHNIVSFDESDSTKTLPVRITTTEISDEKVKAVRAVDGEQPVYPIKINIGLSKLTLFGYAQTGYTYTNVGGIESNAFDITRIILMANAEITPKLSFFIMHDAAKSELHEYYAQYAFSPALKLRIGQYKQPFSLESLLSPTVLNNIGFDASILYMAGIATDPCAGNHVGRDAGIMLTGEAVKYHDWNLLNYSLGVFNGPGMNQKENNSQKDVIGMFNITPLKGVMVSTSFILGTGHAQADNEFGAFKAGANYKRQRWTCGTEIKTDPIYLRSEYLIGNDGGIHSTGYYLDTEFHVAKHFDIVADYDYLKKNNDLSDSTQHNYMIGAQYWLFKGCRILSEFVYKNPKVGNDTKMWVTQFQVKF